MEDTTWYPDCTCRGLGCVCVPCCFSMERLGFNFHVSLISLFSDGIVIWTQLEWHMPMHAYVGESLVLHRCTLETCRLYYQEGCSWKCTRKACH